MAQPSSFANTLHPPLRSELFYSRAWVRNGRVWLHALLFGLTLLTTTASGAVLWTAFEHNRAMDMEQFANVLAAIPSHPAILFSGLEFSLTLMLILMAHEMGHYVACQIYGIDASLPFFLPAPTPIGTLGAFIRIRSPIYTKRALFDVGIAGPLAGFLVLLPALVIGVAKSRIIPGIAEQGDLIFGVPPVLRLVEWMLYPGTPAADFALHPVARAAWVGILATALNLLPIGQLDGGHILYAFVGPKHRLLSRIFVAALVPLGFFSRSWLVWAVLLFFFGLRHPAICDMSSLDANRRRLGAVALVILLLTFTLVPVR